MTRFCQWIAMGSCCALSIACQRETSTKESPLAHSSARPAVSAPAPPPSGEKTTSDEGFELLDRGQKPYQLLRYQFEVGQKDQLVMTQHTNLSMRLGDDGLPATPAPRTTLALGIEVLEVVGDIATTRLTIDQAKVEVDGDTRVTANANVRQLMRQLESYRGTQRVDRRGMVRGYEHDTSRIDDPSLVQTLESVEQSVHQLVSPLPVKSVGRGAKWQTTSRQDRLGLEVTQTATYEITELDDRGVHLRVKLVHTAPSGKYSAPQLPLGIDVELVRMDSKGEGEMEVTFARLAPVSELEQHIDMELRVPSLASSGQDRMQLSMNIEVDLAPQPRLDPGSVQVGPGRDIGKEAAH